MSRWPSCFWSESTCSTPTRSASLVMGSRISADLAETASSMDLIGFDGSGRVEATPYDRDEALVGDGGAWGLVGAADVRERTLIMGTPSSSSPVSGVDLTGLGDLA